MQYPVYRKYKGLDTWFKIVSDTEFFEIKKVGLRTMTSHVVADKFPEKQFIRDMIHCYENRWVEVPDEEGEVVFQ